MLLEHFSLGCHVFISAPISFSGNSVVFEGLHEKYFYQLL